MKDETTPSFLGTGWSFPPRFGPGGVDVEMVAGAEDVHQSLQILLATRRGERPMQESFGCNLDEVVFEEIDQALVNRVTSLIHDSVLEHETRVKLRTVDVSHGAEPGVLRVRVEYEIREVNSRFNLVFPFYLNEARGPGL
jgi:uncharacterized protein